MSDAELKPMGRPILPLVDAEDFAPVYRAAVDRVAARSGRISNSARATAYAAELGATTRIFLESTWIEGDLPRPFRALIRYKAATLNGCNYCSDHQLGYLRKMGVEQEKIDNIFEVDSHPCYDLEERAALTFIGAMLEDAANIPDPIARRFIDTLTPQQCIEVMIVALGMDMLNKINDALRIPLESEQIA